MSVSYLKRGLSRQKILLLNTSPPFSLIIFAIMTIVNFKIDYRISHNNVNNEYIILK